MRAGGALLCSDVAAQANGLQIMTHNPRDTSYKVMCTRGLTKPMDGYKICGTRSDTPRPKLTIHPTHSPLKDFV